MRSYRQRVFAVLSFVTALLLLPLTPLAPAAPAVPSAPASPDTDHAAATTEPAAHPATPLSPAEALALLKAGNSRFAHQHALHPHLDAARRRETAAEQHPIATVLACSDSRVPVEEIFDEGIGDVFVVRVIGNVCNVDETGSIEYGVVHLRTPLVIVLGHTSCGAVTAVTLGETVHGSIPALVDNIAPAVAAARRAHPHLHGRALIPAAIRANVFQSIADLFGHSEDIRRLVARQEVAVIGAIYHLDTGEVEWLGPHPRQRALLAQPAAPHPATPAEPHAVPAAASTRPASE